jgi:hypothetical protein
MSKVFGLQFGSGNPQTNAGLSPTFIMFRAQGISTYPAGVTDMIGPTISEMGVSSGIYTFQFAPSPTFIIAFTADGGAALATADRYVTGILDPIAAVDEKVGNLEDDIGGTMVEPNSVLGFAKRAYGFNEGEALFNKGTGVWTYQSKGSTALLMGFSNIIFTKQLTNTVSVATKKPV